MTSQAGIDTQDIQTKYDEFQKTCKTFLPKIDRKLIEDFLCRQQETCDTEPRYSLEIITREGLDVQKMKDLMWNRFEELPIIDDNGTNYRIEHTLTLGMLKQLSDHDFVLSVNGSYMGPT
jgi:hypothetical protein